MHASERTRFVPQLFVSTNSPVAYRSLPVGTRSIGRWKLRYPCGTRPAAPGGGVRRVFVRTSHPPRLDLPVSFVLTNERDVIDIQTKRRLWPGRQPLLPREGHARRIRTNGTYTIALTGSPGH